VPSTLRVMMVGGTPIGAQHSQSLEAILMHTPGLKVAYPSTPYDAKGLLLSAIDDPDPCVFVECTSLMMKRGPVPEAAYKIPFGKAAIRKEGTDVTIISYGRLMNDVQKAAEELAGQGVSAEVIDLRTVAPLDMETVLASVAKTGRAVVVHEAVRTCGPAAEIATRIHEELHSQLKGPVKRLTAPDSPVPAAPGLVGAFYPSAADIVAACVS
jgi:pyruvate dehydrogenase E1 component beta subunit